MTLWKFNIFAHRSSKTQLQPATEHEPMSCPVWRLSEVSTFASPSLLLPAHAQEKAHAWAWFLCTSYLTGKTQGTKCRDCACSPEAELLTLAEDWLCSGSLVQYLRQTWTVNVSSGIFVFVALDRLDGGFVCHLAVAYNIGRNGELLASLSL